MRRAIGRIAIASLVAAAACRHASSLPYYGDRTLTPRFIADGSPALDTLHRVGEFQFIDQRGRSVSRRTVQGKIVVASFFYASCRQLCPTLRSQLQRVQATFHDDDGVMILSHTIAPESDSVDVLARYARQNRLDDRRWLLLTGTRAEIDRIARDSYFVELTDSGGKTAGRLLHTETFVLVDRAGRIRGVYDGSLAYDVSRLIEDIRSLRRG
jgi:protein SCO1/2